MDSIGAVSALEHGLLIRHVEQNCIRKRAHCLIRVGILGAGSIGCYIGASLVRAGADVVLLGRERLRSEIAAQGMQVSDADGGRFHLDAHQIRVSSDVDDLADRDLVFVTVKSADTESAAAELARLPALPHRIVVSFQNGVGNADLLRQNLPGITVIAGMVPWNVVWKPYAHFHRGTSGELMIEAGGDDAKSVADLLNAAGLKTLLRKNMPAVFWGKLLLNLNNPINALSGLPLRQELAERGYRRILAAMMREALWVMQSAGVHPAKAARLPPRLVPWVLDLPDTWFLRVASSMLKIDPVARSSMWEDLKRGRATEIDYLNGEIVRLAARCGVSAPMNRAMVELIHNTEQLHGDAQPMSAEKMATALSKRS
jgi:2-dehydropantoate 2-reductase